MDVMCKNCGHSVEEHAASCGCWHTEKNPARICACVLFPIKIYQIHISEQQARLDTNRAQVAYLTKERDSLRNIIKVLRGALHSIIGNIHNSEVVLNICDDTLRVIENV